MTTEVVLDEARAGAFAEKMTTMVNNAMLAIMTSIGHSVGLFDSIADGAPGTSAEVADRAGLNERYVREWLKAMFVGGVVEYDPSTDTYRLPPEHAAFTTRAAGPNNIAAVTQLVSLLGDVETQVAECFRTGGGVPYSAYPRFQALMAQESAAVQDAALIDHILPLVDGLVDRMRDGIDVADIGCGQGHAINLMAKAFPNSRFVGYDFSAEGVAAGKAEAAALGLPNATFVERDVTELGETGSFDLITAFDAIHDQAKPAKVLSAIAAALRPEGTFLMVDIKASSHAHENVDHPMAPFLYSVSTLHCMTVSLALDGDGLGTAWGHQLATQMLREAGFASIDVREVEDDIFNLYYVARKM